jgi:ribosomal protein S18 acetylase RimI-like enzyme
VNAVLRGLARLVLGEYEIYRIYSRDLTAETRATPAPGVVLRSIGSEDEIKGSPDPELQRQSIYAGPGAQGFGAWIEGVLAGVCWYWSSERYRRDRNFWPLEDGDVKLVQIAVGAAFQGRGVGQTLMAHAEHEMARQGARRAYARIWHSNTPSIRLFERAGWKPIAQVTILKPLGLKLRQERRLS